MSEPKKKDKEPRCIGKCIFSVAVKDYTTGKEYIKCGSCGRKVEK